MSIKKKRKYRINRCSRCLSSGPRDSLGNVTGLGIGCEGCDEYEKAFGSSLRKSLTRLKNKGDKGEGNIS